MARFRGVEACTTLALSVFGCGTQQPQPATTAQTPTAPAAMTAQAPRAPAPPADPAPIATTPAAQAPSQTEPAPSNQTPPRQPPSIPPIGIERWRAAVESYVPTFKPGDRGEPLNGAR